MKAFRILFFFVMGAFALQSCQTGSSDKVMLIFQPEEGAEYNCELRADSKIEMMGMNMTSNNLIAYDVVVESVSEDTITLSAKYDRIKMDQEMPMMGEVAYDSDTRNDTTKEMGMMEKQYDRIYGKMLGKSVTIKLDSEGKVVSSSGLEGLFQGTDLQMAQQVNLVELLKGLTAAFPDKKVGVGDTWEEETHTTMQVPVVAKNTYTVKNITDSEVILEVKGTFNFDKEAPEAKEMGSADVNGDVSGTVTVDRATGWTTGADMVQTVTAKLPEAGGQPMDIETNITLTTK